MTQFVLLDQDSSDNSSQIALDWRAERPLARNVRVERAPRYFEQIVNYNMHIEKIATDWLAHFLRALSSFCRALTSRICPSSSLCLFSPRLCDLRDQIYLILSRLSTVGLRIMRTDVDLDHPSLCAGAW